MILASQQARRRLLLLCGSRALGRRGSRPAAFEALRRQASGCGHDHTHDHDCTASGGGSPKWNPQALGKQAGPWEVDLSGAAPPQDARGVLQLAGPDAPKLLQGLVTNDVLHLPVPPGDETQEQQQQQGAMAAAFLTNKGRIITDAIVMAARGAQAAPHGGPDKLLIDLPLHHKDAVLRHLRLFKLRAKVAITDLSSSTRVRVLLGPGAAAAAAKAWGSTALSLATDPRLPPGDGALGVRAVLPAEGGGGASWAAPVMAPSAAYEALRLLQGVAEGHDLVERLPSECNVDLLRGVNFAKGCYLGQELTARTQFKGVVRKRLLPFFIHPTPPTAAGPVVASLRELLPTPDASPLLAAPLRVGGLSDSGPGVAPGAEVVDAGSGKALGTVVSSAWPRANVGLALLRLEGVLGGGAGNVQLVAGPKEGGAGMGGGGGGGGERVPLTVFTPLWWPALDLATGKVPSS